MKNIHLGYYVGFILLGISFISNSLQLISYLENKIISEAYSFFNVIVYITLPILILPFLLFIYTLFVKQKSLIQINFLIIFPIHLVFIAGLYIYFNNEINKVYIIVKNLSKSNFNNIRIEGRNNQLHKQNMLKSGDSISFLCNCRKIDYLDNKGIVLTLNSVNTKLKVLNIISSNEPIFQDNLKIIILNDSLSFVKYNESYWYRVGNTSRLFSNNEIDNIISDISN